MKFLRIHLCIFSMILACVNIGNCRELPKTHAELMALYKTKNNGLTEDEVSEFLTEAVKLNKRDMVKTIMNPPLQERMVGDKNNPKPSERSVEYTIERINRGDIELLGINGYLEAIGEGEITQENVNKIFTIFSFISGKNKRMALTQILGQSIKPNQEAMNEVFISCKGEISLIKLLMEQDIKPDQNAINTAFSRLVKDKEKSAFNALLKQEGIKPDQATTNQAFVAFADDIVTVRLLLQQDIKPDAEHIRKAFIYVAKKKMMEVSKLLLQQDAKPDQEGMNTALISFSEDTNAEMCALLMGQDIKPDAEYIKEAFYMSVKKDFVSTFSLLAGHVASQDIQAAATLAGKSGSTKVLKKILDEHSPSLDVVSETLKATAKEFTRIWEKPDPKSGEAKREKKAVLNSLESCCRMLRKNTKQLPNQESLEIAEKEFCPQKMTSSQ